MRTRPLILLGCLLATVSIVSVASADIGPSRPRVVRPTKVVPEPPAEDTPPEPETPPELEAPAEPEAPSTEVLHEGLRALKNKMERALNERDIDTIVANITDDIVFTTMNGDTVRGPDEVRAYFETMLEGPDRVVESVTTEFEPDDLSILLKDDVAIAFGQSDDHYVLTDGTAMNVVARWSGTMVRDGDAWRVASFHYSTNMFDNPVLDAQRSLMTMVGIIAFLVVFGLAFLLGLKFGGRKKAIA